MYHANMCGLPTVEYEVSPLSHILCKYAFNDILAQLHYQHATPGGIEIATYSPWSISPSHPATSSHLVLMFSKDQICLSRAANTGDLCCQVSPAIIEFCNTLQSDANILTEIVAVKLGDIV